MWSHQPITHFSAFIKSSTPIEIIPSAVQTSGMLGRIALPVGFSSVTVQPFDPCQGNHERVGRRAQLALSDKAGKLRQHLGGFD